jgi:hypothetical protein
MMSDEIFILQIKGSNYIYFAVEVLKKIVNGDRPMSIRSRYAPPVESQFLITKNNTMSTFTQCGPATVSTTKSLHRMVNLAAGNLRLTAVNRHSFIINEVSPEFQIETNEHTLAILLNQLLTMVVGNSNHSCIRIEAKEYDDVIFVTVRDNSSFVNGSVAPNIDDIKTLARKMNGAISISNTGNKLNSILLSFPNFKVAA